jgi:hypothetical protein
MKQPYYITSERLEDLLEHQYGLHHRANRSHVWTLTDLLKQSVDTSILYRIYEAGPIADVSQYATPYIPIAGAIAQQMTTDHPKLMIPEKNFGRCISWYITDTAQWILWIQSAQDLSKVWAWEMNLDELGGIQPFCESIRAAGWWLQPTNTLRQHIREWEESNASLCVELTPQVPATDTISMMNGSAIKVHPARDGWTVMQRTPTFAPTWPMLPPIKDEWLD